MESAKAKLYTLILHLSNLFHFQDNLPGDKRARVMDISSKGCHRNQEFHHTVLPPLTSSGEEKSPEEIKKNIIKVYWQNNFSGQQNFE